MIKRRLLALFATALMSSALFARFNTDIPNIEPASYQTRGQVNVIDTKWEMQLIEAKRQNDISLASLVWLEAPTVHLDGAIPLWGLLSAIGTAIAAAIVAFTKLRGQVQDQSAKVEAQIEAMKAHDKLDSFRFEAMTEQIQSSHKSLEDVIKASFPRRR